jgi:hypothetical protein
VAKLSPSALFDTTNEILKCRGELDGVIIGEFGGRPRNTSVNAGADLLQKVSGAVGASPVPIVDKVGVRATLCVIAAENAPVIANAGSH